MPPTPRSLLMVTVWARKGGAERLILDLLDRLKDDFRTALGFVRPLHEDDRTLRWSGPTVGLREILFGEWDLIHTHLFLPGVLIRLRRVWDGGFRWVHTIHYEDYDAIRWGGIRRWIDRRLVFPAADVLVAVSPSNRVAMDRYPQARLIENAIPLDPVEPSAGEAAAGPVPDARGPVVGTVAHLRKEKGLDDLVETARILRERAPGLRVRIAGEGELRSALERRIDALDLRETVELCGFVEDLDTFYRSLDLYVQPSRSEPFGLAALECMRHGLPFVVAEAGFLPQLAGGGRFGEVVPRDEDFPEALARALEHVLEDPETYRERSLRGLEHWRATVSPDRMEQEYREAYRAALRTRVCMVQPVVSQSYGGLARQLRLQTRELARRGHRTFVVQRPDPGLATDAEKGERWRHTEIRGAGPADDGSAPATGLGARIRGLRFVVGGLAQLWRIRHRVDVVHAHQLYSPTLVGALAAVLLDKPLVVKVTSSGEMGERAQLRELPLPGLRRAAFGRVDRVLVFSEAMAEEARALGFDDARIGLLPNCVELPPRSALPVPDRTPPLRLLFTGRLSTEKRLDTLLRAAALAAREGAEVVVDLVGSSDPDRDATPLLRELAAEAPDGCRIRFHGFRPDVERFYREADAFVLPSSTEGLSNALLEAMAWGLPCVVSDIPQNREAVGDAGLTFPVGSAEGLARRIGELVRDRETGGELVGRLSAAARERVRERFSVEVVVDRLESVYAEVAGAP